MDAKRQRKPEPWRLTERRRRYMTIKIQEEVPVERGWWYESAEEIRRALEQGRAREALLQWVHRQMKRRLPAVERHAVEMYYLQDLSFHQVGLRLKVSRPKAARIVRRGIARLQALARQTVLPEIEAWRGGKGRE